MCNLSDLIAERAIAEGMERGMAEGMEKGKELALLDSIRNIMETLHLSVDQALSALQIPKEEWSFYKNQIK